MTFQVAIQGAINFLIAYALLKLISRVQRLEARADAEVSGGFKGATPSGRSTAADLSADWLVCPRCYFAIPAEEPQSGAPHTEPWTRNECPNRELIGLDILPSVLEKP